MAARKPDRRTERSRSALMSAFIAIVLSDGYDAITVGRVAERANVGRSTFYMHYKGKEDILRQSLKHPCSGLVAIVGSDTAPETLIPLLEHFHSQRRANRAFFDWPLRPLWAKVLGEMIEPKLVLIARTARARPMLPLAFVAHEIAQAQIALVARWLQSQASLKPQAVAEALVAATRALTVSLLAIPGNPP
jgi:AcrR family transcriptional regulator